MTSVIGSYYTLSACIDKIPDMKLEDWVTFNVKQAKFLQIYHNCSGAKIPEIESKVSVGDVMPVNEFLKQKGFDIQLEPLKNPRDLAIASVLDVILKWMSEGKKTQLHYNYQSYSAVDLDEGVEVVYCGDFHYTPVAKIHTRNGDTVYMTTISKPSDSFVVFEIARKLIKAETHPTSIYEDRVIFPMVNLDAQPDISWIIGMSDAFKEKWEISQALQQTKVKMDEKGVEVKEAVAVGVRCASFNTKMILKIDTPFLFVVERKGLKEPLFSAYIDVDGWVKK